MRRVLLTAALVATRGGHTLSLDLLLYLALTVVCALVGGIWPALFCAVVGSLVVNWFFTEPRGTLTISDAPWTRQSSTVREVSPREHVRSCTATSTTDCVASGESTLPNKPASSC